MDLPRSLLLCASLCATALAFGQTAPETSAGVRLHCWVGADGAPFYVRKIRCIADRELAVEALPDLESQSVIDVLHRELHFGSSVTAERLFKTHVERTRDAGEVWNIRIYTEPFDSSWQEKRPEQLVRAVLCPRDTPCTVLFTR